MARPQAATMQNADRTNLVGPGVMKDLSCYACFRLPAHPHFPQDSRHGTLCRRRRAGRPIPDFTMLGNVYHGTWTRDGANAVYKSTNPNICSNAVITRAGG